MKVTVEREQCISCGSCWSLCPEVFEESPDDGKSRIIERFRVSGDIGVGEAPESLRESAQTAAANCPMAIIHVE